MGEDEAAKRGENGVIAVQGIICTLPRAFISAYVGLETSNHQDPFSEQTAPSRMGLGVRSRGGLLGSRCLPFPDFPWATGGEGAMRPIAG